jgi:hypothetical protein
MPFRAGLPTGLSNCSATSIATACVPDFDLVDWAEGLLLMNKNRYALQLKGILKKWLTNLTRNPRTQLRIKNRKTIFNGLTLNIIWCLF